MCCSQWRPRFSAVSPQADLHSAPIAQDFMGFLHLGWDIAAKEGVSDHLPGDYSSAWGEVAKHIDLARPGMAAVIRTMGWQPLHLAAMEGKVSLVKTLVQQLGCNILGRSANSWTPMHYAAAHNQVRLRAPQLIARLLWLVKPGKSPIDTSCDTFFISTV